MNYDVTIISSYRAHVLATDAPSCPKSLVGPQWVPRWVPGGSQVDSWWVPGGSRVCPGGPTRIRKPKWKVDTFPKSEKSKPWVPAARILNMIFDDLLRYNFYQIPWSNETSLIVTSIMRNACFGFSKPPILASKSNPKIMFFKTPSWRPFFVILC